MLNILCDENIFSAKEAFEKFGKVTLLPGRFISNSLLKNTDVLLVRSVTEVNESLLKNTAVKFVGTATIGTDHIDEQYLSAKNIFFTNAKGCNSNAVAEYVFSALFYLAKEKKISLINKSFAVIGYGNIGSRVAKIAGRLGMNVLLNDPPLEEMGVKTNFVSIDKALKADIVTLHVPLTKEGKHKTLHLINYEKLKLLKENAVLINASRGAVVNNNDLNKVLEKKNIFTVLDVWEDEPQINTSLLNKVSLATPHIAGYSLEGKLNGTKMMFDNLKKFFNLNLNWNIRLPEIKNNKIIFEDLSSFEKSVYGVIKDVYNIESDDKTLRKIIKLDKKQTGEYFDMLRKNYPYRREFTNYFVKTNNMKQQYKKALQSLRFNLEE